jgi:predicted ribosome quality control (RQC) complex YloA/Tae2 family protein
VHINLSRNDTRKGRILACDQFGVERVLILLLGNVSYKQVAIYLIVSLAEKLTNTALFYVQPPHNF